MKKLLLSALALVACIGVASSQLLYYQPGPRLIDGSQLNLMVDAVNNAVKGPTSTTTGYRLARGETALDGSNPTPVATTLTTIVACTLTVKIAASTGVDTSMVTYGTSDGTLNMYAWKPTGTGDTTLIASTGTQTIGWICVGT